jgi:hypothetical protein
MKSMSSDEIDIETWKPEDPTNFCLDLIMRIGNNTNAGADDFTVFVCTPAWLAGSVWSPTWGRGMLIVHTFDADSIKAEIEAYVSSCNASSWTAIAHKLSRNLLWEFEDYRD